MRINNPPTESRGTSEITKLFAYPSSPSWSLAGRGCDIVRRGLRHENFPLRKLWQDARRADGLRLRDRVQPAGERTVRRQLPRDPPRGPSARSAHGEAVERTSGRRPPLYQRGSGSSGGARDIESVSNH